MFYAPDAPEACAGNPFGRQWFSIPRFDGSTEVEAAVGMNRAADDLNAFLDARLAEEGLGPEALALVGFSPGRDDEPACCAAPRGRAMAGVVAISGKLMRPATLEAEVAGADRRCC